MNPYDFAIQMSRDGEKFFRVLKRQVTKPGLRRILVMLAKDQALHRRELSKMKKEEGTSLDDAGNLSGVRNPFAERIERLAAGEWLDENLNNKMKRLLRVWALTLVKKGDLYGERRCRAQRGLIQHQIFLVCGAGEDIGAADPGSSRRALYRGAFGR